MNVTVRAKESGETWAFINVLSVFQYDELNDSYLVLRLLRSAEMPNCDIYINSENYYIDNIVVT